MYYKEELINGVLMFKTTPNSEWMQCNVEDLSIRIIDQEKEISRLRSIIDNGLGEKDWVFDI